MIKSPLTYVGGKSYMATWIVSHFPYHTHYIEPFAGALHVLFSKGPSQIETVNDIDGDVVNFWLVCRDHFQELISKIDFTPYSRALYEKWKKEPTVDDPVERAARWFYLNAAAVNGVYRAGWSYQRSRRTVNVPVAHKYRRRAERLLMACDRLAAVQIECADFRVMFDRFAHDPDNLLYCDPPYVGTDWYRHNFTEQDHRDLAMLANGAEAQVLISYEDCALIRELYGGWHIHTKIQVRHSKVCRKPHSKVKAVELLIMNYERQPELFDNLIHEATDNDSL